MAALAGSCFVLNAAAAFQLSDTVRDRMKVVLYTALALGGCLACSRWGWPVSRRAPQEQEGGGSDTDSCAIEGEVAEVRESPDATEVERLREELEGRKKSMQRPPATVTFAPQEGDGVFGLVQSLRDFGDSTDAAGPISGLGQERRLSASASEFVPAQPSPPALPPRSPSWPRPNLGPLQAAAQIGRASCRERV